MGLVDIGNGIKMYSPDEVGGGKKDKDGDGESGFGGLMNTFIKLSKERRDQQDHFFKTMEGLPELYARNPKLAAARANSLGFGSELNPDGTHTLSMPNASGGIDDYTIDPMNFLSPEQKIKTSGEWYTQRWGGTGKTGALYAEVYNARQKIMGFSNQLKAGKLTGTDQITVLTAFIKLNDPGSTIKEGEVTLTMKGMPGLDRAVVEYEKLFKDKTHVVSNKLIKDIFASTDVIFREQRRTAMGTGLNLGRAAQKYGMDPDIALGQMGDLNFQTMLRDEKAWLGDQPFGAPPIAPPQNLTPKPGASLQPNADAPTSTVQAIVNQPGAPIEEIDDEHFYEIDPSDMESVDQILQNKMEEEKRRTNTWEFTPWND